MKAYFLDTSVIIDYLRGKQETVELLDSLEDNLCSSYICLAEIYEGVYRVKEKQKLEEAVLQFFRSLSFILGLNETTAKKFGEIRAFLKKQGKVIEDIDILIAVTCLTNDLTLITHNKKHFAHIENLQLFNNV